MTDILKEKIRMCNLEKGSSLIAGIALIVLMRPLGLPDLLELNTGPVSADGLSKHTAALAPARVGIEKTIRQKNFGDISAREGDSSLRTMTILCFRTPGGKVKGDIEINVYDPERPKPLIESDEKASRPDSAIMTKATRAEQAEIKCDPWNCAVFGSECRERAKGKQISKILIQDKIKIVPASPPAK